MFSKRFNESTSENVDKYRTIKMIPQKRGECKKIFHLFFDFNSVMINNKTSFEEGRKHENITPDAAC